MCIYRQGVVVPAVGVAKVRGGNRGRMPSLCSEPLQDTDIQMPALATHTWEKTTALVSKLGWVVCGGAGAEVQAWLCPLDSVSLWAGPFSPELIWHRAVASIM